MAEAATCQPLHVEFVLDEVALGQEFRLVHRCYKNHSTSAPFSHVINLVLTVYNLSNCKRHRNIYPLSDRMQRITTLLSKLQRR